MHKNHELGEALSLAPVVPVMVINDLETAVPMAKALIAGGLKALEITLRTDCALDAVRRISAEVEGGVVGVGTVNDADQFAEAYDAGAKFAVSPGTTDGLLAAADNIPLPYLPGVATPSEAMKLRNRGYRYLKLFPAEAVGGRNLLKSIGGPLPDIKFCPTGGITPASAP
ncbi:MAG: bifunctional 4-hydroxy-2-oxoglutarate aldolase/2-dehydro-3-deoxy-phosphogluconate aldolase, partial [Kordiimonas sp.]